MVEVNYGYVLTEEGKGIMAQLNGKLSSEGVTPKLAEAILGLPEGFRIREDVREQAVGQLAQVFGIDGTSYRGVLPGQLERDIRAILFYKRFGIDPELPRNEHNTYPWTERLEPYCEPIYKSSFQPPYLATFAEACAGKVASQKAWEALQQAQPYSPHIPVGRRVAYKSLIRNSESVRRQVVWEILANKMPGGLHIKRDQWPNVAKEVFAQFPSTQLLAGRSQLADDLYGRITPVKLPNYEWGFPPSTRERYFEITSVLVPATPQP